MQTIFAGIRTYQNAWGGYGVLCLVSERPCWQTSQGSLKANFIQDEKSKLDCGKYVSTHYIAESIVDSAFSVLERVVGHCQEEA